jgi:predicted transcriptional regulator
MIKRDMRYRSRIEIISNILQAANGGGATKIRMMYNAFLSHSQLKEYLMPLVESNMLEFDLDTQTYKTTEKGLGFIELNNRLEALINAEEQQQLQL